MKAVKVIFWSCVALLVIGVLNTALNSPAKAPRTAPDPVEELVNSVDAAFANSSAEIAAINAKKPKKNKSVPTKATLETALKAVMEEPKVRDAAWLNESIPSLMAGVIDDGTDRTGFAEYLCFVLQDHGIRGARIRVMDVVAATKDNWRELGETWCPE